ncbi:hypothetical protein MH117_04345 [Paenibacillus sp. ACRRX]|uniref:DUF7002 family protein n=1 Tax=Paenibacillus sp. ACRRX TaxID=2918206 RepID=UPI001EF6F83B|nr:hypothetical protein [Paenibacillus sp. ACRRX]MCG7406637.1 hypothetical protein [Paenibacillus sp. ACRRX]
MPSDTIAEITKSNNRKLLYHFTRARNLPAIVHFDALFSSNHIYPQNAGKRRLALKEINYMGYLMVMNSHLRIPDSMIDPAYTQEQFRACLDRHVFFWPTWKDCQKMIDTYKKREPDEQFVILVCDAYSLLLAHAGRVKLSKYDSGSAPRFPKHCTYRKSPHLFLPLEDFKKRMHKQVPVTASEIKEVLVESQVFNLSAYIRAVYTGDLTFIPECWGHLTKPLPVT